MQEAIDAGRSLRELDYEFDIAFTSVLKRAIRTLWIMLDELDRMWIPVIRDWRLNERHYGALQGAQIKLKQLPNTVMSRFISGVAVTRESPPALEPADERHPCHDKRYAGIANLPGTESLATTLDRVLPCWNEMIAAELKAGRNVLISAHGNSLRALVKMLDEVSEEDITQFNIPTGIPLVYELDADLKPVSSGFIGDPDAVAAAMAAVANQAKAG